MCWALKGEETQTHASMTPKFWVAVPLHAGFMDFIKDTKEKGRRVWARCPGMQAACSRN